MNYRPEVDGLRTVAVIPVILFHAGFGFLSGGFLGVDVFFVISGYLITTIILSEMDQGKFSIVEFYERRARRILPALFFVMLVSIPFAYMWMLPSDLKDYSQSLISIPLFSSNILFWLESGYFDPAAEMKPLLHTWSLAVEEQFYVLFPIFLMVFWSLRKRWIFASILTLGLLSLILSHIFAYSHRFSSFNFYMLPTRAWELMAGSLVAFYFLYGKSNIELIQKNRIISELLGIIGLSMIFFSMYFFSKKIALPSLYSAVPVLGTVLVLLYSSSSTLIGKVLSSRVFVGIGLISYSLYLWHQPLFVLWKHRGLETQTSLTAFILIAMTFVLAFVSWRFIEKPFRNKQSINRRQIFIFSLAGSLLFIGIGSLGHFKNGFPDRTFWYSSLGFYQADNRQLQQESWNLLRDLSGDNNYGVEDNEYDKEPWFDKEDSKQRLLLIGNSHSKDIFNILFYSETASRRYQLARYGVQISYLADFKHELYSSRNYKESDQVMLASRFTASDINALPAIIEKIQSDGKAVVVVNRIFDFWFDQSKFKNLADYKIFNARQNITQENTRTEFAKDINRAYFEDFIQRDDATEKSQSINEELNSLSIKYNVSLLNRMDYICSRAEEQCFAINEQLEKYFYDYGHHTLEGAKFFGRRIDEIGWIESIQLLD